MENYQETKCSEVVVDVLVHWRARWPRSNTDVWIWHRVQQRRSVNIWKGTTDQ